MYKIFEYIPIEARQAALAATYHNTNQKDGTMFPLPRTDDGYCPLGICLEKMRATKRTTYHATHGCPSADSVASVLAAHVGLSWDHLSMVAYRFIGDWDQGKLKGTLAEAMGI